MRGISELAIEGRFEDTWRGRTRNPPTHWIESADGFHALLSEEKGDGFAVALCDRGSIRPNVGL